MRNSIITARYPSQVKLILTVLHKSGNLAELGPFVVFNLSKADNAFCSVGSMIVRSLSLL